MKLKALYLSVLLIGLSWAGNMAYYYTLQLPKPLFMKHYYDITILNGQRFEIYYLANRSLDRDVAYIELMDVPMAQIQDLEHPKYEYSHHVMKQFFIEFHEGSEEAWRGKGDKVIHQINVRYTDGTSELVDIGEIHLRSPKNWSRAFQFQASGGSNDGTGFHSVQVEEDITILGFRNHFQKLLTQDLHMELTTGGYKRVEINDSVFPIHVKKNDSLYFNYAFMGDTEHYYKLDIRMEFEGEEGITQVRTFPINHEPYFSEQEIKNMVRLSKGGPN